MPGVSDAKGQRLPAGFPLDRRTRQLELRDGPLLLRLAPQRKSDGPPAQRLALALSGQDVFELDVTEQRLRFGDEIVDRLVTVADATLDDDLGAHRCLGLLGLGDGEAEPRLPAASTLPCWFRIFGDRRSRLLGRVPERRRSSSARIPRRRRRSSRIRRRSAHEYQQDANHELLRNWRAAILDGDALPTP